MDAAIECLRADNVLPVHKILKRVTTIQDVLSAQLAVLETMTPQDFSVFRERLNPASGFQSYQFRELEYVSGAKDRRYLPFHKKNPMALAAEDNPRRVGPRLRWWWRQMVESAHADLSARGPRHRRFRSTTGEAKSPMRAARQRSGAGVSRMRLFRRGCSTERRL